MWVWWHALLTPSLCVCVCVCVLCNNDRHVASSTGLAGTIRKSKDFSCTHYTHTVIQLFEFLVHILYILFYYSLAHASVV